MAMAERQISAHSQPSNDAAGTHTRSPHTGEGDQTSHLPISAEGANSCCTGHSATPVTGTSQPAPTQQPHQHLEIYASASQAHGSTGLYAADKQRHCESTQECRLGGGKAKTQPSHSSRCSRQLPTGWVAPSSVVLGTKSDGTEVTAYVEPQRALQCGAHALNAILARSAVSGPGYFYTDLVNSNAPRRPVSANGLPDALIHYTLNGMYSVKAVNHWLYEHTTSAVVLTDIITGYRGEHSPAVSYTQHEILAHAPPGCRAFFVHEGGAQSGHYKAWVESQGQWYECDSLTCTAARDRIKILNERDWELATGKGNTFYCLVARDAYLCDRTLTSPAADVRQDVNTAGVTWVDGTTLEISRHTTRRVPARQTRIPERLDLSDSPLQKETRKELQKTTSSPLELKGPVEPRDAPMQRKVQDTKVGSDKETPKASLKPPGTENTQPTPVPQRSTNVSQKLPASKAHASKHRKERVTKPPWQAATSNKQKKAACHKRQLLPGQRKLNDFLKKPTMQSPKAPTKMPTAPSGPPRFDAQASKPPHTDDQKPD